MVVDGLTVGVGAGEIVGLLGANRSGKSTTLKMIAGEVRPTEGEVAWLCDKVMGKSDRPRRKSRGFATR